MNEKPTEKPTIFYVFAHAFTGMAGEEYISNCWISCLLRLDISNSPNKDWEPKPKEAIPGAVTQTILLSPENQSLGPWAGFRIITVFTEKEKEYIDDLFKKGEEGIQFVKFIQHVCQRVASAYDMV